MAAITQTISVVNRSGKVVNTSKQLKNVFKEAKSAYLERKAELQTERQNKEQRELRKALTASSVTSDSRTYTTESTVRPSHARRTSSYANRRPANDSRRYSSSRSSRSSVSQSPTSPSSISRSTSQHDYDYYDDPRRDHRQRSGASTPRGSQAPSRTSTELVRRHTDMDLAVADRRRPDPRRLQTENASDVDLHLAYGEYHEGALTTVRDARGENEKELSSLVLKAKMLMDEANCAQHSVRAMIVHLQKNPDAMAAVALTLAEISNLASKMAPGALATIGKAAPAVLAILASPEFLIAGGVAVGVTIVALGGYKIIKKIKARKAEEEGADEMLEIGELDRIDNWRRGITDVETASVATSVDGEFITPMAASMSQLRVNEAQQEASKKTKSSKSDKNDKKDKKKKAKAASQLSASDAGSVNGDSAAVVKVKKPSPLRRMFQ